LLKKIMNSAHLTADINAPDKKTGTSYGSLQHFLQVNRAVRIGMLNNPLSGGNRNGLQKIRQAAAAAHPEVLQREVQTPTDVKETLADFARQEVNLLVVNGGDGTVQAALTAIFHKNFFETMPVLAVLRSAGTTSMIAGDIRLFSWARTGDGRAAIIQRPALRVQIPAETEPVYGMFFGAAAIYQATHFCLKKVHTRGVRGEIGAGVALVRFLWAMFLKDRKVVLGLRPFWGSQPKPLHYTTVGAHPRHFLQVLPSLMRGRQGRHVKPANGYISHNIDEARLVLDSGFNLDGELYNPDSKLGPVVVGYGGQASFLQL
jgi:hypothetical protein